MAINYLTVNDLEIINQTIMKISGEVESVIMFPGSLDYCIESVKDLPALENDEGTLVKAAAYYLQCLTKNHAFLDGNKRTSYIAMQEFLTINGYELKADSIDILSEMLQIAKFDIKLEDVEKWVVLSKNHFTPSSSKDGSVNTSFLSNLA